MHINERECALEVAVKMLDLLQHEVLKLLVLARTIEVSAEVEQVGSRLVSFFKNSCLLDFLEVFGYNLLHSLVEMGVVGRHQLP